VQAHLLDGVARVVLQLAVGSVGLPARGGDELAQLVVRAGDPPTDAGEFVGGEGVHRGLKQP
jgi:hypothetical protein